jgi:DNA repair protein RecO (recombination protein O)
VLGPKNYKTFYLFRYIILNIGYVEETMSATRIQGIVLRSVDYGEADRVITFLCRQGGKIGAMARGAQKSKKRFAGVLEIGTIVDADLSGTARTQLYSISRVDLIKSYISLGQNIDAFSYASYAVELVREFTPDREGNAALFDLLAGYLEALYQRGPERWTLRLFELSLLSQAGYAPELVRCRDCGKRVSGPCSFHPALGGLRCDSCDPDGKGGVLLGHGTAPAMSTLSQQASQLVDQLVAIEREGVVIEALPILEAPEERILRESGRLLGRYVEHILGRRVKSLAFIEEMAQ